MTQQRIGIVIKNEGDAQEKAQDLIHMLGDQCVVIDTQPPINQVQQDLPDDLICIIVLGGDGTFLSVARYIENSGIPLMGVKFGEVGFLAETTEEHLLDAVDALFKGSSLSGSAPVWISRWCVTRR